MCVGVVRFAFSCSPTSTDPIYHDGACVVISKSTMKYLQKPDRKSDMS